jgi:hypothetical protein
MDPEENIAASRAALHGDHTPLRQMLAALVDRPVPIHDDQAATQDQVEPGGTQREQHVTGWSGPHTGRGNKPRAL